MRLFVLIFIAALAFVPLVASTDDDEGSDVQRALEASYKTAQLEKVVIPPVGPDGDDADDGDADGDDADGDSKKKNENAAASLNVGAMMIGLLSVAAVASMS